MTQIILLLNNIFAFIFAIIKFFDRRKKKKEEINNQIKINQSESGKISNEIAEDLKNNLLLMEQSINLDRQQLERLFKDVDAKTKIK